MSDCSAEKAAMDAAWAQYQAAQAAADAARATWEAAEAAAQDLLSTYTAAVQVYVDCELQHGGGQGQGQAP